MNTDGEPLGRDDLEAVPFVDQYRDEQLEQLELDEDEELETKPLHGKKLFKPPDAMLYLAEGTGA